MSDRSLRRPWLAALLALLVTGLGHAYLRRWARALGWYLAVAAAVFLFVPDGTVTAAFSGNPPPVRDVAPAAAVVGASVIDAYVAAHRNNREYERERDAARPAGAPGASVGVGGDPDEASADATADAEADGTVRCPECGRETDPTVDFCQWCAEPLGGEGGS
ncbi:zinc ribbon domain-containing protein [Halorubrum tebenquichense]|uniref:DUF7575 domain-containing protein n=1 Tax=Halorubrum tebenquichense DSM 14210 TaxID=1227485 RepID=M0DZS0_9EURY|nr:zinc ribbon domain-containing protein [Halorubrum tebenquichense]ELZ39584.1 hypothetical protein C472_04698 [Halorubrum tebenquichense DSM 14210]